MVGADRALALHHAVGVGEADGVDGVGAQAVQGGIEVRGEPGGLHAVAQPGGLGDLGADFRLGGPGRQQAGDQGEEALGLAQVDQGARIHRGLGGVERHAARGKGGVQGRQIRGGDGRGDNDGIGIKGRYGLGLRLRLRRGGGCLGNIGGVLLFGFGGDRIGAGLDGVAGTLAHRAHVVTRGLLERLLDPVGEAPRDCLLGSDGGLAGHHRNQLVAGEGVVGAGQVGVDQDVARGVEIVGEVEGLGRRGAQLVGVGVAPDVEERHRVMDPERRVRGHHDLVAGHRDDGRDRGGLSVDDDGHARLVPTQLVVDLDPVRDRAPARVDVQLDLADVQRCQGRGEVARGKTGFLTGPPVLNSPMSS